MAGGRDSGEVPFSHNPGPWISRHGPSPARAEATIRQSDIEIVTQYVGTWFPWFQGHPLISGAMPLESGAGFA